MKATVLFETPQRKIASLIKHNIGQSVKFQIVVGFITEGGLDSLTNVLTSNSKALDCLVVGAASYRTYLAFDQLIGNGVDVNKLFTHLGQVRNNYSSRQRFHPMLHSKIFYFEMADNKVCAIIGSHNLTHYAMTGLNGEAAVMLEGPSDDPEMAKIREHIDEAKRQAILYNPDQKDALSWWTNQYFKGLESETADSTENDFLSKITLIILCELGTHGPKNDEILYFEIPLAINLRSAKTEVHVLAYDNLPASPEECLKRRDKIVKAYFGKTNGIETDGGGRQLVANWIVDQIGTLTRVQGTINANLSGTDVQQIRVPLTQADWLRDRYEYAFEYKSESWQPILDESLGIESKIGYPRFFLVKGLRKSKDWFSEELSEIQKAKKEMSPSEGKHILFSNARRESQLQPDPLEEKQ